MVISFDLDGYREVGLVENLAVKVKYRMLDTLEGVQLRTLKELWTRVSSKSKMRHFFPLNSGALGGRRAF